MTTDQRSPAERLAALPEADRNRFIGLLSDAQAHALLWDWRGFRARPSQVAPPGDWNIWMTMTGRGWGKTEVGAQWVRERIDAGARSIALVGETQKDLEEVMVARLVSVFPPGEGPTVRYRPVRLRWPNGAEALGYNGTEPDQLRGPEFDSAWIDELAKYAHARDTWDMLQFTMRRGSDPRQLVTTTPRPIELIREMIRREQQGDPRVIVTRGSTLENAANLAPAFLREVQARYGGSRLGRQELDGELLDDAPGALWTRAMLDQNRVRAVPSLRRVVVGLDPAVTVSDDADETGIIVAAIGEDNRGYVIADGSLRGRPEHWARRAVSLYREWSADAIIAEINQGGDMVAHTIRGVDPYANVRTVRASRGKYMRAEPISALYEQGRVSHVGAFPALEDQMMLMTSGGYIGNDSPDRLDALVWAMSNLFPRLSAPIEHDEDSRDDARFVFRRVGVTGY